MNKKIFKKFVSLILFAVIINSFPLTSFAAEKNDTFNLIEYLAENPVFSKTDFISVILQNGDDIAKNSLEGNLMVCSMDSEEDFSYYIDEANQVIYTKTLSVSEESRTPARATIYQNSATATYDAYSWAGVHVFTVTTKGTFQYDKNSYCNTVKTEGYFNPAFLSLWNASTWINSGNYSNSLAYVDTYGTANLNLAVAEVLGITLNLQSVNYNLELTCDKNGNFDASWTYTKP